MGITAVQAELFLAAFHECDFFFCQSVKVIDQGVNLPVGGGHGVLQGLTLRLALCLEQPGRQSQHLVNQTNQSVMRIRVANPV